jgi:hypothetical protein
MTRRYILQDATHLDELLLWVVLLQLAERVLQMRFIQRHEHHIQLLLCQLFSDGFADACVTQRCYIKCL